MRIDDFSGKGPRLVIEDYLNGKLSAWGLFQDRFGVVRRQFRVDIDGTFDGRALTLTEDFAYDDGETERRVWTVQRTGPDRLVGTADGVIGQAQGRTAGNALHWRYDFDLRIHGRKTRVRFDDWMFLQGDGVLINRATVSKLGVRLGEATIFFKRDEAAATAFSGEEVRLAGE